MTPTSFCSFSLSFALRHDVDTITQHNIPRSSDHHRQSHFSYNDTTHIISSCNVSISSKYITNDHHETRTSSDILFVGGGMIRKGVANRMTNTSQLEKDRTNRSFSENKTFKRRMSTPLGGTGGGVVYRELLKNGQSLVDLRSHRIRGLK